MDECSICLYKSQQLFNNIICTFERHTHRAMDISKWFRKKIPLFASLVYKHSPKTSSDIQTHTCHSFLHQSFFFGDSFCFAFEYAFECCILKACRGTQNFCFAHLFFCWFSFTKFHFKIVVFYKADWLTASLHLDFRLNNVFPPLDHKINFFLYVAVPKWYRKSRSKVQEMAQQKNKQKEKHIFIN